MCLRHVSSRASVYKEIYLIIRVAQTHRLTYGKLYQLTYNLNKLYEFLYLCHLKRNPEAIRPQIGIAYNFEVLYQ